MFTLKHQSHFRLGWNIWKAVWTATNELFKLKISFKADAQCWVLVIQASTTSWLLIVFIARSYPDYYNVNYYYWLLKCCCGSATERLVFVFFFNDDNAVYTYITIFRSILIISSSASADVFCETSSRKRSAFCGVLRRQQCGKVFENSDLIYF